MYKVNEIFRRFIQGDDLYNMLNNFLWNEIFLNPIKSYESEMLWKACHYSKIAETNTITCWQYCEFSTRARICEMDGDAL